MKKILLAAIVLGFSAFAFAQDEPSAPPPPPNDKQSEEIIIRNKGDKEMNMTVQINGDSIYVNGKPLAEFIDSQVSIKKRKMIIHNDNGEMAFDFDNGFGNQWGQFGKQWEKNKEMTKPFLGVETEKADKGVRVVEVVPGSAAEKAGLKADDIITKVNDQSIDDPGMLSDIVAGQKPKDEITVKYIRNKKEKTVKAILGEHKEKRSYNYSFQGPEVHEFEMPEPLEKPEIQERPEAQELPEIPEFNFDMHQRPKLGLKIQDTEDGTVKIIDVEDSSNAAKAGLLKDDIITEIDGDKINNTDEARDHLHPEEGKKAYNIKVLRNGKEMSFDVTIPRKLKTADL